MLQTPTGAVIITPVPNPMPQTPPSHIQKLLDSVEAFKKWTCKLLEPAYVSSAALFIAILAFVWSVKGQQAAERSYLLAEEESCRAYPVSNALS